MRLLAVAALILLTATVGAAQEIFTWFYASGTGNFAESPVVFSGGMSLGGDVSEGSWEIRVSDVGWPSDPEQRISFVWDVLFAPNYARDCPHWPGPQGPGWEADYCTSTPNTPVDSPDTWWLPLHIQDDTNGGSLAGWCSLRQYALDEDEDGTLDVGEFPHGWLIMDTVIICEGYGAYDGLCGSGNAFGEFGRIGVGELEGEEDWRFGMYLWLEDCMNGCDPPSPAPDVTGMPETWDSTWSTIKAMYR